MTDAGDSFQMTDAAAEPLAAALVMLEPLVQWAISQGIGHGQLSRALKLVFFEQAKKSLLQSGARVTDSALSLQSGLHKGDVLAFKAAQHSSDLSTIDAAASALRQNVLQNSLSISPAQRVVARWNALGLPHALPFKAPHETETEADIAPTTPITSFTQLVLSAERTSSQGYSPRLLLQDMERQGLVQNEGNKVRLLGFNSVHKAQLHERTQHFVAAARDFLMAGVTNLSQPSAPPFLEQSFQGDGFHAASVQELEGLARAWWGQALQAMGPVALEMNQKDVPQGGRQRMNFGVYFYTEDMQVPPAIQEPLTLRVDAPQHP